MLNALRDLLIFRASLYLAFFSARILNEENQPENIKLMLDLNLDRKFFGDVSYFLFFFSYSPHNFFSLLERIYLVCHEITYICLNQKKKKLLFFSSLFLLVFLSFFYFITLTRFYDSP